MELYHVHGLYLATYTTLTATCSSCYACFFPCSIPIHRNVVHAFSECFAASACPPPSPPSVCLMKPWNRVAVRERFPQPPAPDSGLKSWRQPSISRTSVPTCKSYRRIHSPQQPGHCLFVQAAEY